MYEISKNKSEKQHNNDISFPHNTGINKLKLTEAILYDYYFNNFLQTYTTVTVKWQKIG